MISYSNFKSINQTVKKLAELVNTWMTLNELAHLFFVGLKTQALRVWTKNVRKIKLIFFKGEESKPLCKVLYYKYITL